MARVDLPVRIPKISAEFTTALFPVFFGSKSVAAPATHHVELLPRGDCLSEVVEMVDRKSFSVDAEFRVLAVDVRHYGDSHDRTLRILEAVWISHAYYSTIGSLVQQMCRSSSPELLPRCRPAAIPAIHREGP